MQPPVNDQPPFPASESSGGNQPDHAPPPSAESSALQREVATLRLLFQINSRLRLETLAALSKVFREHGVQITDNLLASLVFALTEELPGQSLSPVTPAGTLSGGGGRQPPWEQPPSGGQPEPISQPPTWQPPTGQPPIAQPPIAQPPIGQPPSDQPPTGQPPMSQPPMDQPPMDQPPTGQPATGQPPTRQPPMGQPPSGDED